MGISFSCLYATIHRDMPHRFFKRFVKRRVKRFIRRRVKRHFRGRTKRGRRMKKSKMRKKTVMHKKTAIRPFIKGLGARTKVVKMRWCNIVQLDPGLTQALVIHKFQANNTFKPNITEGADTHQPYGRDQFELGYTKYRVLNSTIRVRRVIINELVGVSPAWGVFLAVEPVDHVGVSWGELIERGILTQPLMSGGGIGDKNQRNSIPWLKANYNMRDFRKKINPDSLDTDWLLNNSEAPPPFNDAHFVVWAAGVSGNIGTVITAEVPLKLTVQVDIEYEVEYSKPSAPLISGP